jgi:hypothetical protein
MSNSPGVVGGDGIQVRRIVSVLAAMTAAVVRFPDLTLLLRQLLVPLIREYSLRFYCSLFPTSAIGTYRSAAHRQKHKDTY